MFKILDNLERRLNQISDKDWFQTAVIGAAFAGGTAAFLAGLYSVTPHARAASTNFFISEIFLVTVTTYFVRDVIKYYRKIENQHQ